MSRGVKILIGIVAGLLLVVLIGVVLCTLLSAPVRSSEPGMESEATGNPGGAEDGVDDDVELARGTLIDFFEYLNAGDYLSASELYGGSYEG